MTFNVRYDEPADGRHAWRYRKDAVLAMMRDHDPDLLGLQEPLANQWEEIAQALPDHSPFGVGHDESGEPDPRGGFVKAGRFEVVDRGAFWLSDTPQVPYSVTWPNDWGARACAWIRLRDRRVDRALVFANTHLDTNAGFARPSAKVLHRELVRIAGRVPVILVGDFNRPAGSDAHRYLCSEGFRDAWLDAGCPNEGSFTYNGFAAHPRMPPGAPGNNRIDWILIRGALTCISAAIDSRQDPDGLLPSDHFPVIALLDWVDTAIG